MGWRFCLRQPVYRPFVCNVHEPSSRWLRARLPPRWVPTARIRCTPLGWDLALSAGGLAVIALRCWMHRWRRWDGVLALFGAVLLSLVATRPQIGFSC